MNTNAQLQGGTPADPNIADRRSARRRCARSTSIALKARHRIALGKGLPSRPPQVPPQAGTRSGPDAQGTVAPDESSLSHPMGEGARRAGEGHRFGRKPPGLEDPSIQPEPRRLSSPPAAISPTAGALTAGANPRKYPQTTPVECGGKGGLAARDAAFALLLRARAGARRCNHPQTTAIPIPRSPMSGVASFLSFARISAPRRGAGFTLGWPSNGGRTSFPTGYQPSIPSGYCDGARAPAVGLGAPQPSLPFVSCHPPTTANSRKQPQIPIRARPCPTLRLPPLPPCQPLPLCPDCPP